MPRTPLSGTQYTLRACDYEAVVASVGASLRTLRHGGRDLVVPFDIDEVRPGYRGAVLAPWPNRVVDGRYTFAGAEHQAALTEPERGHALHGLTPWLDFSAVDRGTDHVTLAAVVEPQAGYPWRVRVETTYALDGDGLTQTVRAVNESADAAPFGTAPHPYLVAGPSPLDTWTVEVPATRVLEVTPDRLSPVALRDVADHDPDRFDLRAPHVIGSRVIDHAYTGLLPGADGRVAVRVTDPVGGGVELSWGAELPWAQVYTGDVPGGAADPAHRVGLAIEPMTCAPDAFNADRYDFETGLLVLEPGAEATASWRFAAI